MFESHKIFTFAELLRFRLKDGVIQYRFNSNYRSLYNHYKFHKHLNYRTFKKYLVVSLNLGLFKEFGVNGSLQLKSRQELADTLGYTDNDIDFAKINYYFNEVGFYGSKTLNDATKALVEALVFRNFARQKHSIQQKYFNVLLKLKNGDTISDKEEYLVVKRIFKKIKKMGVSLNSYLNSQFNNFQQFIKTGCEYIGELFGISKGFANNIINRLKDKGLIDRKINRFYSYLKVNKQNKNFLINLYPEYKVICLNDCFLLVKGSYITIL